jgi:hypothetical protein
MLQHSLWTLLLTAILLVSTLQGMAPMEEENAQRDAGRQGVASECEGLTFEDMFNYSHADFNIVINDDWQSAFVRATAWINHTLADGVRTDFDLLFEPLGSDNGWLSTDEYAAVRNIASDCVEQTNPRIGLRGGPAHRGGDGVNWYNASWENSDENPMVLEEWNLMPMHHADERPCQSSPNNDCVEIPTAPITGRDCDTRVTGPDECRMIIWLNATLNFNGLFGQAYDEFTVAVNTSNMTDAQLDITYPALDGLRVGAFEECDGRLIDQANNDNQGTAPVPGTCTSDESISTTSRLVGIDGETRLRVDTLITYDMEEWPVGQDMFFDMTTEEPDVDDPPFWTGSAPAEGDILPIPDDGRNHFLSDLQMSTWASDDHGAPLISCTGGSDWAVESDADGLSANPPAGGDSTTITCQASDAGSQVSSTRNFTLQVPMRVTGTVSGGEASITLTPTAGMPSMETIVTLTQSDAQMSSNTVTLTDETTVSISLSSMSAGPFLVRIAASGSGMASHGHTYDLDLSKDSSPPTISISSFEWIDSDHEMTGMFSDPDGDSVTITATDNGLAWGTVITSGNQWMASGAGIPGALANQIILTACDSWGECTTLTHEAGATPAGNSQSDNPSPSPEPKQEGGGLPGFGILAALGAIALAGLKRNRRV